jgi:V8-like Glu-specific endopeptidase
MRPTVAACFLFPIYVTFLEPGAFAQAPSCRDVTEPQLMEEFGTALIAQRTEQDSSGKGGKPSEPKPIYGCDDRKNFYQSDVTEAQKKAASATAVVVRNYQLHETGSHWEMPHGSANFCSPLQVIQANHRDPKVPLLPERFWKEPAPGFCSAFKVGPRVVATAGHCIKTETDCTGNASSNGAGTAFVFGFKKLSYEDSPETEIDKNNVYKCVRILGGSETDESDWRIVQVDRDIDAPQVAVRTPQTTPALQVGEKLTVIGYPRGLPVKIADGGYLRKIKARYFEASLSTYGGNSGSPVFNSDKLSQGELLVEGILVRGDSDFAQTIPCYISKRCPSEACRGEDVTLASEFEGLLESNEVGR